MDRRDWSAAIKQLLANEDARPATVTLKEYGRLLGRANRAMTDAVTEWEVGEVLGFRAFFLESQGRAKDALREYLKLARLRRGYLISYGHALASALENAVMAATKAGQRRTAVKLAQEVVKLRADYPDAGIGFQEAVNVLAAERKRQNQAARKKQLGLMSKRKALRKL
jgi:hypothetical protein